MRRGYRHQCLGLERLASLASRLARSGWQGTDQATADIDADVVVFD
jgi:hypothetical protein